MYMYKQKHDSTGSRPLFPAREISLINPISSCRYAIWWDPFSEKFDKNVLITKDFVYIFNLTFLKVEIFVEICSLQRLEIVTHFPCTLML